MKKKFVGVYYESDDSKWRIDVEGDHFHLFDSDGDLVTTLLTDQVSTLAQFFHEILVDTGAKEPIQIANIGDGFVPTVSRPMDMRFHPDPDGVMGL